MNRAFVTLFVLLAMLLPCLTYGAAAPVVVTHTLTGYNNGADGVTFNCSLHVVNPGDTPLSEVSILLVPRPPLLTERITVSVGNLGAHQSTDIPLQLVTRPVIDIEKLAQTPLFWAGTCRDAEGNTLEFPVKSRPGGDR